MIVEVFSLHLWTPVRFRPSPFADKLCLSVGGDEKTIKAC